MRSSLILAGLIIAALGLALYLLALPFAYPLRNQVQRMRIPSGALTANGV